MKLKPDNKGISLAMTIGLLLLLVTLTTTVNELVIRALRASHQIEAADKAYLAAEAGVENALYELSAHSAGYQTAALGNADVRQDDFNGSLKWKNEWEIANHGLNDCDDMELWMSSYFPTFCGRIYENEKLVINLFSDDAVTTGVDINGVNETDPDISSFAFNTLSSFLIKFRLPRSLVSANSGAFSGPPYLKIDNDGDYDSFSGSGLNEDGDVAHGFLAAPCPYSGGIPVNDNDCDGREDEDSPQDPVFLWKVTDDAGHSFEPLRGCKGEGNHPSHPAFSNAVFCENSFTASGTEISALLTQTGVFGVNQDGVIENLRDFIIASNPHKLQLEILPVAPFTAVNPNAIAGEPSKILIPYLEYGIVYGEFSGKELPSTYFSIRSDGYYQDFKQSITTNVVPRATTRLLDLTIIQQ